MKSHKAATLRGGKGTDGRELPYDAMMNKIKKTIKWISGELRIFRMSETNQDTIGSDNGMNNW